MSILTLSYIEAPLVNGKRLFRGKAEVGLIRNEDLERFKKNRDQEPPVQLHPSQYSISKPLDVDQVVKDVTDAINEFNEAFKNSTWKEVDNND